MTIAAGTRLGSYEVLAQIGAGGMGLVYEAEDLKLHRRVVLNWFEELKRRVPTGTR
jgi:serine/threonine protein kinase